MQQDWISRAAKLLNDPVMMEWALHYYHGLPPRSELKGQLENLWFHDLTLQCWMDGDEHETISQMFYCFPEQHFSRHAATIARKWITWPAMLASRSAGVLANASPALAAETFGCYLETAPSLTLEKVSAILENLNKLAQEDALTLLEKLLPLADDKDAISASIICKDAFAAAVWLKPEALPHLLDGIFKKSQSRLNNAVKFIAHCLFGHDAYAEQYFLRKKGYEVASFMTLTKLFDDSAPLAEMDEVVRSKTPLPAVLLLLETHHDRLPEADVAWNTIKNSDVSRNQTHPVELAALALAGVAAAFERRSVVAEEMDEVIGLLSLDVSVNIHYDALVEKLRSFPREEIVAAVTGRIGEQKNTLGGVTLARLMGELNFVEFTRPLIGCIDETHGDYLCGAARDSLINLGEPARDALIAQWDELDKCQKIYGLSVINDMGGIAAADFAFNRFDELMGDSVEYFCKLALSVPDPRILKRLRLELRRKQMLIDQAYYCLCRLLDENLDDLPGVHARILQERNRSQTAQQNFRKGDFVSGREALYLSLRCTACHGVNNYEVKRVEMDAGGKSKALIADEFPCLSCGSWAEFELEPTAHMALVAEMLRLKMAHEAGEKNIEPLIFHNMAKTYDGSTQSLASAYAAMHNNVRNDPNDWLSLSRLGNLLVFLNRPRAALECFKKAHAINSLSLDVILNLAGALINAGEKHEAFNLLSHSLKDCDRWQAIANHPAKISFKFAELFNQLRRDLGRTDLPALHPEFLGPVPKVGRNDACPCGSGRKFKKCCMN